ncbi:hypothetical protein ACOMHN_039064 [Nucella lapillus]
MKPEDVTRYLRQHPEFLQDYVSSYVNTEQLQDWLRHKARHSAPHLSLRHHHHHDSHAVNGDVSSEGRSQTLTKWQSRIQCSKGKLLQELSRERSESQHSKSPVLLQLSACIASAISADGHNFYTVDGKRETIRHVATGDPCREEGMMLVEHSPPLAQRDTVAAHAAFNGDPVHVTDLAKDARFPGGLGCGSNNSSISSSSNNSSSSSNNNSSSSNNNKMVSSVLALPVCDASGAVVGG